MEYILYMLAAAGVSAGAAALCKSVLILLSEQKLGFKAVWNKLVRTKGAPLGTFSALCATTLMAHEATYAGSSVGAGYNLASLKALPFFALLVVDIFVIIYEIVQISKDKPTRKIRIISMVAGVVMGVIIAALTLRFFVELGCPMPWYGG